MKFVHLLLGSLKGKLVFGIFILGLGVWGLHKGIDLIRSVNRVSFNAQTISLSLNGNGNGNGNGGNGATSDSEAYAAMDISRLLPGASLYVGLTVDNSGNSSLRYGMVTTPSGNGVLAQELRIGVAAVSGGCNLAVYAAGTSLYTDQQGLAQAAFTGRALGAGVADHLCFHLQLPLGLKQPLTLPSGQATFDFTAQRY